MEWFYQRSLVQGRIHWLWKKEIIIQLLNEFFKNIMNNNNNNWIFFKNSLSLFTVPPKVDGSNLQVACFLACCQHAMRTLPITYIDRHTMRTYWPILFFLFSLWMQWSRNNKQHHTVSSVYRCLSLPTKYPWQILWWVQRRLLFLSNNWGNRVSAVSLWFGWGISSLQ